MPNTDPPLPGLALYDQVKHLEGQIKSFPKKRASVVIGTYDAKTQRFTGYYTPEDATDSGHEEPGAPVDKPHNTHNPPVKVPVDGVYVTLIFKVANYAGQFTVTCNGATVHSKPGESSVAIDVGAAIDFGWSLSLGANRVDASKGTLVRPAGGAGAFTIPMMPITIVYEPPVDHPKNYAKYTVTKSIGNTAKISFTDETTTKKPIDLPQYASGNEFKTDATVAAKALSQIPNEYAKAVGGMMSILALGMDTVTSTLQTGSKTTTDHQVTLTVSESDTFPTAAHLGPGLGDLFVYIRNVKLAWLVQKSPGMPGSTVSLTMLGYEILATAPAKALKDDLASLAGKPTTAKGAKTGLGAASLQALLNLDPFAVHGADATLDPQRFSAYNVYEVIAEANDEVHTLDSSTAITDAVTKVSTTVETDDYSEGFWTAIGIGDPSFENKTVVTSTQHSSMGQTAQTSSAKAELHLFGDASGHYAVKVFYDKVFGTFAFKRGATSQIVLTDILKDDLGHVVPNTPVVVTAGGHSFTTVTDAGGRFTLRSDDIPNGPATLTARGIQRALTVKRG